MSKNIRKQLYLQVESSGRQHPVRRVSTRRRPYRHAIIQLHEARKKMYTDSTYVIFNNTQCLLGYLRVCRSTRRWRCHSSTRTGVYVEIHVKICLRDSRCGSRRCSRGHDETVRSRGRWEKVRPNLLSQTRDPNAADIFNCVGTASRCNIL